MSLFWKNKNMRKLEEHKVKEELQKHFSKQSKCVFFFVVVFFFNASIYFTRFAL